MANPQILRDMTLFVEVARRRSFSQAATALDMPVSSLSRRISNSRPISVFAYWTGPRGSGPDDLWGNLPLPGDTPVEDAQRSFDELIAQAKAPSGFLRIAAPPDFWAGNTFPRLPQILPGRTSKFTSIST